MGEEWRARDEALDAIAAARKSDPFAVLGPHQTAAGWVIRVFAPDAISRPRAHPRGQAAGRAAAPQGRFLRGADPIGQGAARPIASKSRPRTEPRPTSTPMRSGRRSVRSTTICCTRAPIASSTAGSAPSSSSHEGVDGVLFARLGAQCDARLRRRRLQPVGRTALPDAQAHSTAACGRSSSLTLTVGASTNTRSSGPDGALLPLKADPFGFEAELRPSTASVVADSDDFAWTDAEYMAKRGEGEPRRKPMSIYEVHLGSWRRGGGRTVSQLRRTRRQLIPYVVGHGLHPYRAAADQRASARRILGLPADRPVRADPPLRRAGGLRPLRRPRARARASA